MWEPYQNIHYDSLFADLANPFISQDTDGAKLPRCRTCKKTLNDTIDRQKTRDKWWANCKSCRTTNTTKQREKRDSGFSESGQSHVPRKPTGSPAVNQIWCTKSAERAEYSECSECGGTPSQPWITACGHLMCDPCYEDFMQAVVESGKTRGACGACNLLSKCAVPYEQEEEDMLRVKATKKRKRAHKHLDVEDDTDDGGIRRSKPAKSALETMECSVCGDIAPAKEYPKLSACEHKPEVCKECFLGWLNSQMDSTSWEQIRCPSSGCSQSITHADVKMHGSNDLFTRFDGLSMRAFLSNDPDFRYCLAEACTSGQIHDTGSEGNIFRCNACDFRVCTVHDVPFHTGETCDQYDERRHREEEQRQKEDEARQEHDELSRVEIQAITMKCPECEAPIQKNEGCDHMTCRCRFQFCYICCAPYRGKDGIWVAGNKVHSIKCKYHPDMLPDFQDTEP